MYCVVLWCGVVLCCSVLSFGCNLTHDTDRAIAEAGFDRLATEWWTTKSDWSVAHAQARAAKLRAQHLAAAAASAAPDAKPAPPPPAPKIAPSGSVSTVATGTKPVLAGIAVKAAAPVPPPTDQHQSSGGFMNYGFFRS